MESYPSWQCAEQQNEAALRLKENYRKSFIFYSFMDFLSLITVGAPGLVSIVNSWSTNAKIISFQRLDNILFSSSRPASISALMWKRVEDRKTSPRFHG